MNPIPPELLERLKMYFESEDMGFGLIGTSDFIIILAGKRNLGANDVAILAAHALLNGVVNGLLDEQNEKAKKKEEKERVN